MEVEAIAGACRRSLDDTLQTVHKLTTASPSATDKLLHSMNGVLREAWDTNFTASQASLARLFRVLEQSHAALIGECDSLPLLFFARSFAVVIDEAARQLQQAASMRAQLGLTNMTYEDSLLLPEQVGGGGDGGVEEVEDEEEGEGEYNEPSFDEELQQPHQMLLPSSPAAGDQLLGGIASAPPMSPVSVSSAVAMGGGRPGSGAGGYGTGAGAGGQGGPTLREQLLKQLEAKGAVAPASSSALQLLQQSQPQPESHPPHRIPFEYPDDDGDVASEWTGCSSPREDQVMFDFTEDSGPMGSSAEPSLDAQRRWSDSSSAATAAGAAQQLQQQQRIPSAMLPVVSPAQLDQLVASQQRVQLPQLQQWQQPAATPLSPQQQQAEKDAWAMPTIQQQQQAQAPQWDWPAAPPPANNQNNRPLPPVANAAVQPANPQPVHQQLPAPAPQAPAPSTQWGWPPNQKPAAPGGPPPPPANNQNNRPLPPVVNTAVQQANLQPVQQQPAPAPAHAQKIEPQQQQSVNQNRPLPAPLSPPRGAQQQQQQAAAAPAVVAPAPPPAQPQPQATQPAAVQQLFPAATAAAATATNNPAPAAAPAPQNRAAAPQQQVVVPLVQQVQPTVVQAQQKAAATPPPSPPQQQQTASTSNGTTAAATSPDVEANKGKITIFRIPPSARVPDVIAFLKPIGAYLTMHMPTTAPHDDTPLGYALVKYESNALADAAVKKLHGTMLGGAPVVVRRSVAEPTFPDAASRASGAAGAPGSAGPAGPASPKQPPHHTGAGDCK